MAFLNSTLFNFLYVKRFNDLKILKGNLSTLPFPKISTDDNQKLSALVDLALNGDKNAQSEIDDLIFSFYGLEADEITQILNL